MADKFVTVYALFYGPHYALHRRLGDSLMRHLPRDQADLAVWGNVPEIRSVEYLTGKLAPAFGGLCHVSGENVPKYKVMRQLFTLAPPRTPWILWFDDDSHIVAPDWYTKTRAFITAHEPGIVYVGKRWYIHYRPGQTEFVQASRWYKHVPFEHFGTNTPGRTQPGVAFANGAYWWLRTDVLRQLDWPDPRLNHNGGDTLLGEAVRQQGHRLHDFMYGIKGNDADRRGFREPPAGSTLHVRY